MLKVLFAVRRTESIVKSTNYHTLTFFGLAIFAIYNGSHGFRSPLGDLFACAHAQSNIVSAWIRAWVPLRCMFVGDVVS